MVGARCSYRLQRNCARILGAPEKWPRKRPIRILNGCGRAMRLLWRSSRQRSSAAEVVVREAGGAMPPDDALLGPINSSKTVAEVAVSRERREPNQVAVLKQQLEQFQEEFPMQEGGEGERETGARCRLDDALRTSRSKTQLLATLGHDLRQPLTVLMATLEMLEPDLLPIRLPEVRFEHF